MDAGGRPGADHQQRPHRLPRVAARLIHANHLPLDFWSFHHYADFSNDPLNFTRISRGYRKLLDDYGFRRARILLTEWNYALTEPTTQLNRAAFAASSLALMQDAPIARAVYHRADREGGPDWQLINDDGSLSKTGHAFEAVGALRRTPLRLAARGGDDQGFSVLAAAGRRQGPRPDDQLRDPARGPGAAAVPRQRVPIPGIGTFQLLDRRTVTYTDNAGYDLTVKGLHGRSVVRRYRVDASHDLTLVDRSVQHGSKVHLSAALPAPAVELVEIARA